MGSSISWDDIKNGNNFTVEIAKVLQFNHDKLNERCTLGTVLDLFSMLFLQASWGCRFAVVFS